MRAVDHHRLRDEEPAHRRVRKPIENDGWAHAAALDETRHPVPGVG